MIGDGVNDVIALKQANVAVAMQGGSQAARSVGDLILMKDTFAPLPFAFREGQRIINGMNDILRIFMVRIFFKAAMIAIVMTDRRVPVRARASRRCSRSSAPPCRPSPSRCGRSRARRPRSASSSCWRGSSLPTVVFMTAIGTGVYLAWAHPGRERRTWPPSPAPREKELIANAATRRR